MKLKFNYIKDKVEYIFKIIGIFIIDLLNKMITKLKENSKIKHFYTNNIYFKKEKISKKIGLITCCIVVILSFILVNSFMNRGYKSVCRDIIKGTFEADSELIVKHYPDELLDYMLLSYEFNSMANGEDTSFAKEELISDLNSEIQNNINSLNNAYGDGWNYSYEITDTHDYSKDDISQTINDSKNDNFKFGKFDEMKGVKMIITLKKNGKEIKQLSKTVILMKRNGTWFYIN